MAQVKFGKGTTKQYGALDENKKNGMVFFNTEDNQIYLNGTAYGVTPDYLNEINKIGDAFVDVDYADGVITFTDNNGNTTKTVTIPIATESNLGLMSKAQVTQLNNNTTAITTLNGEATVPGSVKYQVADALDKAKKHADDKIEGMDFAELSADHKFVSLISQEDGKINAELSEVTAGDVVFKTETTTNDAGEETTTVTYTDEILEDLIEDVKSLNNLISGGEAGGVADQIKKAIEDLDVTKAGETGKYLQFIEQVDGKIVVDAAKQVEASEVSFSSALYDTDTKTVDVALTEVMTDLNEVSQKLGEVEAAAKSYSLTAATKDELAKLDVNVLEAYKLVDEDDKQVGDWIKIYKDSSLIDAKLDGQKLILTYSTYIPEERKPEEEGGEVIKPAEWKNKDVEIDVSVFLAQSEFKDGLEVLASGEVQVKVDDASEKYEITTTTSDAEGNETTTTTSHDFLSVSAAGVKISGIQDAIDRAIDSLDATVGNADVPEDKHVAIQITEENGKITNVKVSESDIASAAALTGEINRASGVENAIIGGVGLSKKGEYVVPTNSYCLNESTSIMDAISKLDTAISVLEWWEDTPSAE